MNSQSITQGAPIQYRVGFFGTAFTMQKFLMPHEVEWSRKNLQRLKDFGFNTVQINMAWGSRPGDEPLNLEDVLRLEEPLASQYPQTVELRCKPGEEAYGRRREMLRSRANLCKEMGFHTIFHFGAPYNAHLTYRGTEPNCTSDEKVLKRYALLLEHLVREFPGIDDILVYTYDQDAWLCSEFADCPRCAAIPIHERLPAFVNGMNAAWRTLRPEGRLWWEPWGISAGVTFECIKRLNAAEIGLAVHSNFVDVMAANPADRYMKNVAALGASLGMPVIAEYFLGDSSEEIEPLSLAYPLTVLRGLKAIADVPGVVGIKEYFGLVPDRENPNLRMTALFFENPRISEGDALLRLAEPYGAAADGVIGFWRQCSMAMEFYPWDAAWMLRWLGHKSASHAMDSEDRLHGFGNFEPVWYDQFIGPPQPDHPHRTEDVQLRLQEAADHWRAAEEAGWKALPLVPAELKADMERLLLDTGRARRRALALAYHKRETNIARVMRHSKAGHGAMERARKQMLETLLADRENFREEMARTPLSPLGKPQVPRWPEMDAAIAMVQQDPALFLRSYFQ